MHEVVIDNSVVIAWCFPDEKNSYAMKVLRTLASSCAIIVPALWTFEAANAFLVGERKKRSTATDTSAWTQFLAALPITIDNQNSGRLFNDILNVARIHNLSAYDAAYLELAMRKTIPLATLDGKLKTAAQAAGVMLYDPAAQEA
jgi:predicted nucleic acid-binding protein